MITTCEECDGTGRVRRRSRDMSVIRWVTCPVCHGSGTVEVHEDEDEDGEDDELMWPESVRWI